MSAPIVTTVLAGLLFISSACADDRSVHDEARTVGQKTGEVVHQVGEAGKEVGQKVVEVARDVGHATRDGAKEFHKAVTAKGKKKSVQASSSSSSASSSK